MPARSRHAVIVQVTLTYVLAWAAGLVLGLVAMATVDARESDDGSGFAALGFLALGFVLGVLVGHGAWTANTVRLLRTYGRPGRTVATVVLPPLALVLLMVAVNDLHVPWQLFPVVGVAVPAVLAAWSTAPR